MDLRQAGRDELYNIAVFLDDCWRQVYWHILSDEFLDSMSSDERHKSFIKRYDEGASDFVMMFDNESLVGVAVFGKSFTEGYEKDVEISAIYLRKDYIGRGYGHSLIIKIEQALRDKGYTHFVLDVLSENTRALNFYLKHGYEKVADRTIRIGKNEYPLTVLQKSALFEYDWKELDKVVMQLGERSKAGYKAVLRNEKKSDWKTVEQITYRAFRDAPLTGSGDDGNEALLARKLRSCASFVPELDYVAEIGGKIIGNIMYTRSKVVNDSGGEWETLTFGPISVLPKHQREGVGSALIRRTLYTASDLGYRAVLIFGHESYYPRFGFKPASEFGITTTDGKNFPAFMALPLCEGALDGIRGRFILDDVYTTLDREESEKLNAKLAEPMDVDEYIEAQPLIHKDTLQTVRQMIRVALPDAMEKISWQMPTYCCGKNLIHFAAQKYHIGIYPGAEAMEHFKPRLAKYVTSKGAIRFPYKDFGSEQLRLITEIAAWCGKEKNNA